MYWIHFLDLTVFCVYGVFSVLYKLQTILLLFQFYTFIFLAVLLWLGLPVLCWIKVKVTPLFWSLIFRENAFSFSPPSMVWTVGLSCMAIMLRYVPFIPQLLNIFLLSWRDVIFCQMLFLHQLRCTIFYPSFLIIMWYINVLYYMYWFVKLKYPYITGIYPTWSWYMILIMYCWILSANILLRIVYIYAH